MADDPSSEAESTERLSIFRLIGILTRLMRPYWRRGMRHAVVGDISGEQD